MPQSRPAPPAIGSPEWLEQYSVPETSAPASAPMIGSDDWLKKYEVAGGDNPADRTTFESVRTYLGEALASLNPKNIALGLDNMMKLATYDPLAMANLSLIHVQRGIKAKEELEQGNTAHGLLDATAALVPMFGPRMGEAHDAFRAGDTAKGLGIVTDLAGAVLGPKLVKGLPKTGRIPTGLAPSAELAETLAAGDAAGVPRSLASSSGNPLARVPEIAAAHSSFAGAGVTAAARADEAAGISNWASALGEKIDPSGAKSPYTAGQMVRGAVQSQVDAEAAARVARGEQLAGELHPTPQTRLSTARTALEKGGDRIAAYDQIADDRYSFVRSVEADPTHATKVPGTFKMETAKGTLTLPDGTTKTVPLAVNMGEAQKMLGPMHAEIKGDLDRGIAPTGLRARAFSALERVMNAESMVPLSSADRMLGDLKAISRTAKNPLTRNIFQGTAAAGVKALEAEVQSTAAKAGPEVVKALSEGRAAVRAKYATEAFLKRFQAGTSDEPVLAANKLFKPRDENLTLLQGMQTHAPEAIPAAARTMVDELITMEPEKAAAKYAEYGPQAKSILFKDPAQRAAADTLFAAPPKGGSPAMATLKDLPKDPVNTLARLSLESDGGAAKLAALETLTGPAPIRALSRALFEDIANKATQNAAQAAKDWKAIDPGAKLRLIKDPILVKEVNHFFSLAEILSKAPPKAGGLSAATAATAHVLAFLGPALSLDMHGLQGAMGAGKMEVAGYLLAKGLNSRTGVKLLTQGLTTPVQAPAAVAVRANLLRLFGQPTESPDGR